jgi:aspartate racemase
LKIIGLIGGMSWESSLEYYRCINQQVKTRLGGFHSAKCLMLSVDFAEIEDYQRAGAWEQAGHELAVAAANLERGGAECIVLCTNTMHKVAPAIEAAIAIPFIHIADAAAKAILDLGLHRVALLGTRFTMEEDFYRGRLEQVFGLQVLIPEEADRDMVHRVIFEELVLGIVSDASRRQFIRMMQSLAANGAQGIILGCTEIGLLVSQADSPVPVFDTTLLHARAAVEFSLA